MFATEEDLRQRHLEGKLTDLQGGLTDTGTLHVNLFDGSTLVSRWEIPLLKILDGMKDGTVEQDYAAKRNAACPRAQGALRLRCTASRDGKPFHQEGSGKVGSLAQAATAVDDKSEGLAEHSEWSISFYQEGTGQVGSPG